MANICPGCTTSIGYLSDHHCQRVFLVDTRTLVCECGVFLACRGHRSATFPTHGIVY